MSDAYVNCVDINTIYRQEKERQHDLEIDLLAITVNLVA